MWAQNLSLLIEHLPQAVHAQRVFALVHHHMQAAKSAQQRNLAIFYLKHPKWIKGWPILCPHWISPNRQKTPFFLLRRTWQDALL